MSQAVHKAVGVQLWRMVPPQGTPQAAADWTGLVHVAARQALVDALRLSGLRRPSRVAVPEWSSHCLLSAVGRIAMPLPVKDALTHSIPMDSLVIYEQWGWENRHEILSGLATRCPSVRSVIIDRVDSAALEALGRKDAFSGEVYEVFSLYKALGLLGGGLLRRNGKFIPFEGARAWRSFSGAYWRTAQEDPLFDELLDIHKSRFDVLHPRLERWLRDHDLEAAYQEEYETRRRHLRAAAASPLAECWTEAMRQSVKRGIGPSCVPLGLGSPPDELHRLSEVLAERFSFFGAIYHFDRNLNPFNSDYTTCYACPVHGDVADIAPILRAAEECLLRKG